MVEPKNPQLTQSKEAPFNMAIATLKRLDEILVEIKTASSMTVLDPVISQSIKINLVRQFFLNAIPLLEEKDIKRFRKTIFSLRETKRKKISNSAYGESKVGEMVSVYDYRMDLYLDNILVEVQLALQKNRFFMPSSNNPRYGWGSGD